jgi:hypothetical protein
MLQLVTSCYIPIQTMVAITVLCRSKHSVFAISLRLRNVNFVHCENKIRDIEISMDCLKIVSKV